MPNKIILTGSNPRVGTYADGSDSVSTDIKIPTIALFLPITLTIIAIYLAYKNKMGFWGYVGYMALAGIVGYGLGTAIIVSSNKDKIV